MLRALRRVARRMADLAVYVTVSSILGLVGWSLWQPWHAFAFFASVWREGNPSGMVFIVGSVVAALVGFDLARRGHLGLSLAAGFVLTELTYLASFMLLREPAAAAMHVTSVADAVLIVTAWGFLGISFATVAPAAAGWERRQVNAPRACAGRDAP